MPSATWTLPHPARKEATACPVEYKSHDAPSKKLYRCKPSTVRVATTGFTCSPLPDLGATFPRSGSWKMLPGQRRPRLRVDVEEARASVPNPPKDDGRTKRGHLSISVFRYDHIFGSLWHGNAYIQNSAYQMQIHVHSPSVKVMRRRGYEPSRTMPVYSEHDTVEGVVFLDPHLCSSSGSLTISVSFIINLCLPIVQ